MMTTEQEILQDQDRVTIDEAIIDAIVKEIAAEMNRRIENIDPSDDPSAEYGEYWERGSCEGEDCIYLEEPYDEYEIGYNYELSWRYREWTEYWTDPVCYPTFDEMDSEEGCVTSIEIYTPDGDEVKHSVCNEIVKRINELI